MLEMLDVLISAVTRFRSRREGTSLSDSTQHAGAERRQESQAPEERSALFVCPDCETVYIATDKQSCSQCAGPVERVPSTLDGERPR